MTALQNSQIQQSQPSFVAQVAQKVSSFVPFIARPNARNLLASREFDHWQVKAKPLVPTTDQVEAQTPSETEEQQTDNMQPYLSNYESPLDGAAAWAAHKKYSSYAGNPVAFNGDIQNRMRNLMALERKKSLNYQT